MKQIMELIQPMQVVRCAEGYWSHPGIPDFDESAEEYRDWLKAQGLQTTWRALESEDENHPAYKSYYGDDDTPFGGYVDISEWNPAPPDGEEWFTLSIHDSEDGPFWVWAKRVAS